MTTAIVIDWGLFPELALRLARDIDNVYYHSPWASGSPDPNDALIGKGFEDSRVERVDFPFETLVSDNPPDVWIFPDILFADLQAQLRRDGHTVWGVGWGETLETDRWKLRQILSKAKAPVVAADTVEGIEELDEALKRDRDRYVKIAQYFRGITETFHHQSYLGSQRWLNDLRAKTGPAGRHMKFMLQHPISGDSTEPGVDLLVANGKPLFPGMMGYEIKGSGMISRVIEEIPQVLWPVETLFPFLIDERATTFFSCETRIIDRKCYVLDPCCRLPSPGDALHMEGWRNLTQAILLGAQGETITLDPVAAYAAQVRLYSSPCKGALHVSMPEEIRDMVKLHYVYRDDDGELWIMLKEHPDTIGGAIGFGDSPEEAFKTALAHAEAVEMEGLKFDADLLTKAEKEIRKGEKNGIEF